MTMVVDKSKNIVAIYSGPESAAVEDSPLDHLDKVKFHSSLPYVEVLSRVTGSVVISSSGWSVDPAARFKTLNLFAHGLAYTPFVMGVATNLYDMWGNAIPRVPLGGTVPVITSPPPTSPSQPDTYYNYPNVSLVADATHVKLYCRSRYQNANPLQVTLNYTVDVTNIDVDGGLTNPPNSSDLINIDDDEVTIAGIFSNHSDHLVDGGTVNPSFIVNGKTYHDRFDSHYNYQSFYYARIDGTNRLIPYSGINVSGRPENPMTLPGSYPVARKFGEL